MVCSSLRMIETMTGTALIVLVRSVKERGGTAIVVSQISMGLTLMVRATLVVSHGTISMLPQEVGVHFVIQT